MNPDLSKLPLCGQDWNAMEPLGDGRRLCARCRHPVADFRGMTKHQIALAHAMSDERVCGVYSPEQLAPVAPAEPRRCRSGLVTLALGASLLAARAEAQATPSPAVEHAQLPRDASPASAPEQPASASPAAEQDDTLVIRGTVREARSRARLQGAVVVAVIDGTQHTAVTDAAGGYVLRVPHAGRGELTLRFGMIARQPTVRSVPLNRREVTVDATLESTALLGLVGYVVAPTPEQARAEELRRRVGYSVSRITGSR